jgi:hypothetical protein
LLRGPFEPATHGISIFVEAKWKFQKKVGIEIYFVLRLKKGIVLLKMVDMQVSQARQLCGEMSTLLNTKNPDKSV